MSKIEVTQVLVIYNWSTILYTFVDLLNTPPHVFKTCRWWSIMKYHIKYMCLSLSRNRPLAQSLELKAQGLQQVTQLLRWISLNWRPGGDPWVQKQTTPRLGVGNSWWKLMKVRLDMLLDVITEWLAVGGWAGSWHSDSFGQFCSLFASMECFSLLQPVI